jgi:hypothetical protein
VNLARFPVRATDDIECRRPAGFPPTFLYSLSWEDPREDAKVLDITPNDTVLTLTSGGCNALDIILQVSTTPPHRSALQESLGKGGGAPRSPGVPTLESTPPAGLGSVLSSGSKPLLGRCSNGTRERLPARRYCWREVAGCHLQHVHFPLLAMGRTTVAHHPWHNAPASCAQPSPLFHCGQCGVPWLWGTGGLCLLGVGEFALLPDTAPGGGGVQGAKQVVGVDMNPAQSYLLELKRVAVIR